MITTLLIAIIVTILTTIFSILPIVTTLPTIGGYDIDSALVSGIGQFYHFSADVWPVAVVLQGAFFLFVYYGIKMVLKFLLGHRAPGSHA